MPSQMVLIIIYQKNMSKIKKYGKFGKKMLVGASSGIIAGMFLMGVSTPYITDAADFSLYSGSSYGQNTNGSGMHMTRRWNSKSKINLLTNSFGLDREKVQAEIKAGKTLKQVLHENGIETTGLQNAFEKKGGKSKKNWKKV